MSGMELFKVLEAIVRKYSKMPVRLLIENYLRVKVVYNLPLASLQEFLSNTHLSAGVLSVFLKRSKMERSIAFTCVIIDHPKLPAIAHKILQEVENCIVLDPSLAQYNNILGKVGEWGERKEMPVKAILLRSQRESFETLSDSLDAYLSICELFHSHIHLTLNCFEAPSRINLHEHLTSSEGDQFEGVVEEGYFRILEERAGRVTLQQLSETCLIERTEWGELLIFQEGHDGLIIWVTEKQLPKLGICPPVAVPGNRAKQYPQSQSSQLGFKIFKRRQVLKEKLHELRMTTLIFNCHAHTPALDRPISAAFDRYCRSFFSEVLMKTELQLLQENLRHGERISDILGIEKRHLLHKLLTIV